ncbi:MAG TPA: glutamine-hydrolyzing carbamoyl-phosphate synthase small subunit [Thermoplasmata archaeon]|jgi:carbamoyl-phosphate synthase small subunit|nr:glutamine-hydrolyzing carbamoyl-phosphate synthase small subunit [Thermoplasmata archaeon]
MLRTDRLLLPFGFLTPVPVRAEKGALHGTLLLEDGTRFEGRGIGAPGRRVGEVVFTTGMVGYPESLTDPSFRGQILTFTYPLLGNYGVPPDRRDADGLPMLESDAVQPRGVIVRGTTAPNHWSSARDLSSWLRDQGIPGIEGVDTRRLTEHLRTRGVVRGALDVAPADRRSSDDDLLRALRAAPQYAEESFMAEVAPKRPKLIARDGGPLVAVLDCGIKASILRALLDRRLSVLRLPYDHEVPTRWDGKRVAALVVGNGPGDPAELAPTIEELRRPTTRALPTLGICLGHQLIALARGGTTFKLKYGHRGQNKTIQFPDGRALIVSENHGYAVDPASLGSTGLKVWATNPDDGTVEGLRDAAGRVLALQGHPEGHPGPQEAGFVFDRFAEKVRRRA